MDKDIIHNTCEQMLLLGKKPLSYQQVCEHIVSLWQTVCSSDACVLLSWNAEQAMLTPCASMGMVEGFSGRSFALDDHPRLQQILQASSLVRFASDSPLPDPYDGLIKGEYPHLPVHDCMGLKLECNEQIWGVITLDSLNPKAFDGVVSTALECLKLATEAVLNLALLRKWYAQKHYVDVSISTPANANKQYEILGNSAVIQQLRNEIALVAPTHFTALILGESGVGKELVAHAIHQQSNRQQAPFVTVNCAALPDSLLESELFGHIKGAFSGADKDRLGKFELAQHGTLFLDEVGELSLTAQAKLLRVLQNGDIQRVGSDQHHQVDVRVIAATNRDLLAWVKEGKFRADLYHRLSVYPLTVPPLRERGYDILLLAAHFLSKLQKQFNINNLCLTQEAETQLLQATWLGNVRELEHCLSRATLKASQRYPKAAERIILLQACDLHIDVGKESRVQVTQQESVMQALSLKAATDQFQRQYIQNTLQTCQGNKAKAAQILGVDRSNLQRVLKRLGMF